MTSQEKGARFEKLAESFFVFLFEEIGFTIIKARAQKSGNQSGFDLQIVLVKNYIEHRIYIECKNYKSDLDIGNIFKKAWDLEKNYYPTANDLFIPINPKARFSNEDNSEKSSPVIEEKFDFKYYKLDITNGVRELFALQKEFYKEIYGDYPDFSIDKEKEISRFENIIFSRKPFKKIILNEKDKNNFITHINTDEENINRLFVDDVVEISSYFGLKEKYKLQDILKNENKLFVLGNPGSGKSTELYKLANELWVNGEQISLTPIFIRLKNFTTLSSIESLLPKQFDDLKSVIFIFDGIDEVKDIEDFKSKLEQFISVNHKNKELGKTYKYIISCRTNIFEAIVHKILDFKAVYILDITYEQAIFFLKNKCGDIIDKLDFYDFTTFLKNPFQINLLASYIKENRSLPKCTSDMWDTYIAKRLKIDEEDKLKNFNPTFIKAKSKNISLICELMRECTISDDNLFSCCNCNKQEFEEFKKNPLIDKIINTNQWAFEHKNIQEYFAALTLCTLKTKTLIEFIQIEKLGKTHPSLFNTISFILNLISEDSIKHKALVDWLVDHEPEILFRSDGSRISDEIRERVFQIYFKRECIEKTLWLTTNKTFSMSEIVRFSNCPGNVTYLMGIIKENYHSRVIITAVSLLSSFSIPPNSKEKLKTIFLQLLNAINIDIAIKSEIIDSLTRLGLFELEPILLKKVFSLFENEKSKIINYSLLRILSRREDIDSFMDYLAKEFKRVHKIESRDDGDDLHRGNSRLIQSIIIRLSSFENFLIFFKYYLQNQNNLSYNSGFEQELMKRCIYFINQNNNFLIKIIDTLGEKINYDARDLLQKIIKETNLENIAVMHILNSIGFDKSRYFIAHLVNLDTIDLLIDNVKKEKISDNELEGFRNYIGNTNSRELAAYFHHEIEKNGIKFSSPTFSSVDIEYLIEKIKMQIKDNLDVLFQKKEFAHRIKSIFIENEGVISGDKLIEIENKWYNDNGHNSSVPKHIEILRKLSFDLSKDFDYNSVEKIISQDTFLFNQIRKEIGRNENSTYKHELTNDQIQMIISWTTNTSSEIDFSKIISLHPDKSFSYSTDYNKFNLVLYFLTKFKIELPKTFLLNGLQYYQLEKFEIDDDFYLFRDLIGDNENFNRTIVDNLNTKNLFASIARKHIAYALESKLSDSYKSIRNYIIQNNSNAESNTLNLYIDNTRDYDVLKECCINHESQLCWNAIEILVELKKEKVFCINIAKKYLESLRLTTKTFGFTYYCTSLLNKTRKNSEIKTIDINSKIWVSNAIGVFIKLNHIDGLDYFINYLNLSSNISHFSLDTSFSYNNIKNYSRIEYLYNASYQKGFDEHDARAPRLFFDSLLNNLSKEDNSYKKVQKKLQKIRRKILKHNLDPFYINLLIEQSIHTYINSRSIPYTFKQALEKSRSLQ